MRKQYEYNGINCTVVELKRVTPKALEFQALY